MLSPIEVMTSAGACTERIRLGCVVLVITLHNPEHLAANLATLDQLSAAASRWASASAGPSCCRTLGLDSSGRVARFSERLGLIRALWTEPSVTFGSRFWRLDQAGSEPKPFRKPRPRIWFGGGHAALQRAVRQGDAFFAAGSATTALLAEQVRTPRGLLQAAGRDPDKFPIAKRAYVALTRTRRAPRLGAGDFFDRPHGRRGMTGSPSSDHPRTVCAGSERSPRPAPS